MQLVPRTNPCNFCEERQGLLLSQVDYWDISSGNLVKCPRCSLAQIDPMPTDEMMDLGCTAFYRMQHMNDSVRSIERGFARAFRKGVALGVHLKHTGITPQNILEIGSGDGYFSRGLQFVFPQAQVTCLDIVEEFLEHIRKHHGFKTIKGTPESMDENIGPFDFVIARDIIEHLGNPSRALRKLASVTKRGGHLHFITPNGVEDYWGHMVNWRLTSQASEVLLNHVNYFEPNSLKNQLGAVGFKPVTWFNYDFKGTRQGYGRVISHKLSATVSTKRSAQYTLQKNDSLKDSFSEIDPRNVLKKWLFLPRWLVMIYCYVKHHPFLKLNADYGVGHEIFCIARKV